MNRPPRWRIATILRWVALAGVAAWLFRLARPKSPLGTEVQNVFIVTLSIALAARLMLRATRRGRGDDAIRGPDRPCVRLASCLAAAILAWLVVTVCYGLALSDSLAPLTGWNEWYRVEKARTRLELFPICGSMTLLGALLLFAPAPPKPSRRPRAFTLMLHMALAGLLPILILSAVHGLTPYLVLIAIDGVAHAQGGWSEQGSIQTTVGTRLLGVFLPAALTLAASLAALLWQRIELSRSSITPAHFGASRLFRLLLLLASALAGAWLIVVGFPLVDPSFASGIAFQFDRYVLTLTLLSLATLLSGLVARALAPGRLDPESHSHGQWWRVSRVAGLLFWYFFAGFLLLYSASSLVSAFMDDPLATVPVPGSWLVDLNDHVNRVLAMIAAGAQRPVFGASPLISTTWFVYFVAAYVAMGLLFDSWHEAARTDSRPIAWLCGSPARIGLWIYETLYALLATLAAVPAVVLLSLIIVHVQNVGLPY